MTCSLMSESFRKQVFICLLCEVFRTSKCVETPTRLYKRAFWWLKNAINGDLVGAEAIYSRLLVLDPADSEVLYLLGYLKANKGEMDVGLECLSLAHQLTPDNPQIPYTMGVVLQEAGKLAEAVDAYQKVVAIDRRHVAAWENLSAAFYDQEDYASGLAAAEKVLAFNRESPLAIRAAANCLTALGRRAEALEILDKGVRYHPALPELRIHRSWELMANGRFEEAWPELEWRHARRGGLIRLRDPCPIRAGTASRRRKDHPYLWRAGRRRRDHVRALRARPCSGGSQMRL